MGEVDNDLRVFPVERNLTLIFYVNVYLVAPDKPIRIVVPYKSYKSRPDLERRGQERFAYIRLQRDQISAIGCDDRRRVMHAIAVLIEYMAHVGSDPPTLKSRQLLLPLQCPFVGRQL